MRKVVIKTTQISNKREEFTLPDFFWLGTPRSTRHAVFDRLNHTRLQTDRPKAHVGLVGLLTTLPEPHFLD